MMFQRKQCKKCGNDIDIKYTAEPVVVRFYKDKVPKLISGFLDSKFELDICLCGEKFNKEDKDLKSWFENIEDELFSDNYLTMIGHINNCMYI
jgi:hypothetical protein